MRRWNYQMVGPALQPRSLLCTFCRGKIGADKPERRFWPMHLTDDERSRISFVFVPPKREEEFGLCVDCFADICGGQYRREREHGRTEHIYETPDDWIDLLGPKYDEYVNRSLGD